jgi:hypothetical protein
MSEATEREGQLQCERVIATRISINAIDFLLFTMISRPLKISDPILDPEHLEGDWARRAFIRPAAPEDIRGHVYYMPTPRDLNQPAIDNPDGPCPPSEDMKFCSLGVLRVLAVGF